MISILKDILLPITSQYHDLGHSSPIIDRMMDEVKGRGHRLKYGHDMQAMIESYHLEGIEGVGSWFDHMLKDFTSTDGIPLPFARTIKELTGMDTVDAIDWLCINATDVIGLGGQMAAMQFFKNNPKAYKLTMVIGTALGIVDDNPLLVGYNALLLIKGLKNTGRLDWIFNRTESFLLKSATIVSNIAVGTAVVNLGLVLVGANLSDIIDGGISVADSIPILSELADWADMGAVGADIIDGFTTLGIGILASQGIKHLFKSINKGKEDNLVLAQRKLLWQKTLQNNLMSNASPQQLSAIIDIAGKNGAYKQIL